MLRVTYAETPGGEPRILCGFVARALVYRSSGSRMDKTVQRRLRSLNSQRRASSFSKLHIAQRALASLLALVLLFAAYPQSLVAQDQQASAQAPAATYIQQTRVGRAHRSISRFARGANIGGLDLPRPGG
jgi:hypothetical protein